MNSKKGKRTLKNKKGKKFFFFKKLLNIALETVDSKQSNQSLSLVLTESIAKNFQRLFIQSNNF